MFQELSMPSRLLFHQYLMCNCSQSSAVAFILLPCLKWGRWITYPRMSPWEYKKIKSTIHWREGYIMHCCTQRSRGQPATWRFYSYMEPNYELQQQLKFKNMLTLCNGIRGRFRCGDKFMYDNSCIVRARKEDESWGAWAGGAIALPAFCVAVGIETISTSLSSFITTIHRSLNQSMAPCSKPK